MPLVPYVFNPKKQRVLKSSVATRFLCSGQMPGSSLRLLAAGSGGIWYPVGALGKMCHLIAKHGLEKKFIHNDDECLQAAAVVMGVRMINAPSCLPYGFQPLEVSINGVGACQGLWTQRNGVQREKDELLEGDLVYHSIFSHRFPEYGHRNAYEAMDVAPHPDVIQAVGQSQCPS